jgi:hypothetical protein
MNASRLASMYLAASQINRYFFFVREPVGPENEWMVEATFKVRGRPEKSYLMPLDREDDWGAVGRNALATEWEERPESQVPPLVKQKARERVAEHWSELPTE